eukprot:CAMPEP_0171303244 /NCGR_PEP_ID=MMETSP0816-20121228/12757_1 /TAXON_ID=420281 /ORGANISM="Proboscia inermis, Strain CCAP1064/1" /LENGTH=114 /DNA_ID=CAMNT_0011782359 /DNA_START=533 /DNA_END=877 /DNA_ORIENTATION=+
MFSLQGVLNLFVYQRLLLKKQSLGDRSNQPRLDPLEQRISSSKRRSWKMLCLGIQPEFSIFDGTNASNTWGSFIHNSSHCEEDEKIEEYTEAIQENDKTNEESLCAIQEMTVNN